MHKPIRKLTTKKTEKMRCGRIETIHRFDGKTVITERGYTTAWRVAQMMVLDEESKNV